MRRFPAWAGRLLAAALVFACLLAVARWRFTPWMPEVFFGDDLDNLLAFRDGALASTWHQAFAGIYLEKYRPVFAAALHLEFTAFGDRIEPYLAVNLVIHAVAGTLLFQAARLLCGSSVLAALLALAFVTSRLALYQVTQVTGVVEGLGTVFFLGMVLAVIHAGSDPRTSWRWSVLAVAAAFLALHTHERYVVVLPWLVAAFMALPSLRSLSAWRKTGLIVICAATVAFNVLYKVGGGSSFFVGTGGTHIDFNPLRTVDHAQQAVLTVFGFNDGPHYLAGGAWSELPWFSGWILGAGFLLSALALLGLASRSVPSSTAHDPIAWRVEARWAWLLAALAVLVLVPPLTTIHLEQRWLVQSFALLLLLLAWAAGRAGLRVSAGRVAMLVATVAALSIALDLLLSAYFGRIFFVYSGHVAALVRRDIVSAQPGTAAPVALVLRNEHCEWTLRGGRFFTVYGGQARPVRCFSRLPQASGVKLPESTTVYEMSARGLSDVTEEWRAKLREVPARAGGAP